MKLKVHFNFYEREIDSCQIEECHYICLASTVHGILKLQAFRRQNINNALDHLQKHKIIMIINIIVIHRIEGGALLCLEHERGGKTTDFYFMKTFTLGSLTPPH